MSKNQRGRNNRVATPRLPKFLKSSLPDTVKAAVAAAAQQLEALWAVDPEATIPPDMLVRLNAVLGCATIETIDLLRILTMRPPHMQAHTPQNLGALLRGKQEKLGRLLKSADFPDGHRMHIFAAAYWGGIEAWSASSGDRKQQPNGYWLDRRNQIAALQRFAAERPKETICHASLHEAGLHRLATMLSGAELEALAVEAGLERRLKRLPDQAGRWTREVVVTAYADLCRTWGVTLSSHALGLMKGSSSTLRGHAQRAFGRFGAMVDAAIRANPDLQPPKRYVAKDGTRLDSQSEVVVWNALRAALPAVAMVAHVILPGEDKRSTDVLLEGFVHVEVLMVAVEDMPNPANKKVADYAGKWACKVAIHSGLGIIPILFEPLDVFDPVRTAGKIAEAAERLAVMSIPAAPPTGRVTRGKGHWDHDALCAAVAEVAAWTQTPGRFPTHQQLIDAGYGQAVHLLKAPGKTEQVAVALGLAITNRKNVWTKERVLAELVAWCKQHGRLPTTMELQASSVRGLASAQQRLWAGEQEALRAAVNARLGKVLSPRRAANGVHGSLEQVARLLEPLARELGRMPTGAEYHERSLGPAWSAASRTWGVQALADALGMALPSRRARRRKGGQGKGPA